MELHPFYFQRNPLAIKQILTRMLLVGLQLVDIDLVLVVDRVGPAQVFVHTVKNGNPTRKQAANDIPALFAAQVCLIPGHRPFEWLVRVDSQVRSVIGCAAAVKSNGIGAALTNSSRGNFATKQITERLVDAGNNG